MFDAECATCNRALMFMASRLPRDCELSFVRAGSQCAEALLADRPHKRERDSLVYLDDTELLQGGAAVLRALSLIPRWRIVGKVLELLPDSFVESAYDNFAANRYRWNRGPNACPAPSAQLAERLFH